MVVIAFIILIRIKNHINSEAKIITACEWILQKSQDGSIRICDLDHPINIVHSISSYQVEHGYFIEFNMNKAVADVNTISIKDTIGMIRSFTTERDLANLNRDLANAESFLKMSQTGEKEAIIKMAKDCVNQAQIPTYAKSFYSLPEN